MPNSRHADRLATFSRSARRRTSSGAGARGWRIRSRSAARPRRLPPPARRRRQIELVQQPAYPERSSRLSRTRRRRQRRRDPHQAGARLRSVHAAGAGAMRARQPRGIDKLVTSRRRRRRASPNPICQQGRGESAVREAAPAAIILRRRSSSPEDDFSIASAAARGLAGAALSAAAHEAAAGFRRRRRAGARRHRRRERAGARTNSGPEVLTLREIAALTCASSSAAAPVPLRLRWRGSSPGRRGRLDPVARRLPRDADDDARPGRAAAPRQRRLAAAIRQGARCASSQSAAGDRGRSAVLSLSLPQTGQYAARRLA